MIYNQNYGRMVEFHFISLAVVRKVIDNVKRTSTDR